MAKTNRSERFVMLAEKRVTKAINAIRLIGNLASPSYGKTDQQVECIKGVLENTIAEMLARFEQHYKQDAEVFSFESYEPPTLDDTD